MNDGKQVADNATKRWKTKEFRKRVVMNAANRIMKSGATNKKYTLPELVQIVERYEEKVNASAKTEDEYMRTVTARVKSIEAHRQAAEAKNLISNPSPSGTDANNDWRELVYKKLQFLKEKFYSAIQPNYQNLCTVLQTDPSTQVLSSIELETYRYHKSEMEKILSLFELSKSQITADINNRTIKAHRYLLSLPKTSEQPNMQQPPHVQLKQQFFGPSNSTLSHPNNMYLQDHGVAMPIGSSQRGIMNQSSIVTGTDNAVQQQTNIAFKESCASINAPRISATEQFGASTSTQKISPLIKENNNQNQVSQKPTLGSEEQNPAIERMLNVLTSISPEALSHGVGGIKEVVRLNDEIPGAELLNQMPEMVDELGLPTFTIPEGWKMPHSFVATTYDIPMHDAFNQFADSAEADLNSSTMKGKCPQTVKNQNILAEIKDINNQLFDCEVVIAEQENVESAIGLLLKIMYNAVTINQDLVSHFTYDKKSLIKPLWLLIPSSYPSSSLVILDELPLEVSEDLRALFERAKAKLRFNLQSMNEPWLIKDITRAWESSVRDAILDYAQAIGGGTFDAFGWESC